MCSEVTVNSLVTVTIVTYKVAPDRDGAARRLGRAAVAEAASKKTRNLMMYAIANRERSLRSLTALFISVESRADTRLLS